MTQTMHETALTGATTLGILSHFFPPDIGGIPRLHSYSVPQLHHFGVDAVVLTNGRRRESRIGNHLHIERVPSYGSVFAAARAKRSGGCRVNGPTRISVDQVIEQAIRLFRAQNVSVVNTHIFTDLKVGIAVADALGIPHVHTAHSAYRSDAFVRQEAATAGTRHAVRSNDAIRAVLQSPSVARYIVHTEYMRKKYNRELGVSIDKLELVRPGIDLTLFRRDNGAAAKIRSWLGLQDEILITCPTLRKQGFDFLLRAYARFRRRTGRAAVLLCTDTPTLPGKYADLVESLGLSDAVLCRQLPARPANLMAGLFSASDVVALCSTEEGIGLPAIEARACGTPVITHRFGPFPELINDGVDGIMVDTGDIDQLAEALANAALRGRERASLVENGLHRARCYPHTSIAPSYAAIFRAAAKPSVRMSAA